MVRIIALCIGGLAFLTTTWLRGDEETLVDNWDNGPRSTGIVVQDGPRFDPVASRRRTDYENKYIALDYVSAKVGAFSVVATPSALAEATGLAFDLTSAWSRPWELTGDLVVEGWLRTTSREAFEVVLFDAANTAIITTVVSLDRIGTDRWQRFSAKMRLPNASEIATLAIRLQSPHPLGDLAVDGVTIRDERRTWGVTDRSVEDWVRFEKETREARQQSAIENGAAMHADGRDRQILDQLWLGREIEKNNAELRDLLRTELKEHLIQHLPSKMRLIMAYYELGSRSRFRPARLEPETEKLVLEILWEFTRVTNDIATARQSTWWLTGSENHDFNTKASALITSRIFMSEPAYRERVYPDLGRGTGYGHWQQQLAEAGDDEGPMPEGNFKDGKEYRAADHYKAWVAFFEQYFAERARHGFFLENGSSTYMKWTLNFIHALHAYSGDEALRKEADQFLSLVWADWAQLQLTGIHGGPKTRHQGTVGGYDPMTAFARFFLGGPGTTEQIGGLQLFDGYEWPDVIWDLALDVRGRGSYAVLNQGVGEESPVRPRPPGLERAMLLNPEARILKSSWITPDYIIGTQMEHPDAIHSHLNTVGRWQGMICIGDPSARLVTTSTAKANGEADMEILFQSVQAGSTLITQQARRWNQINPIWFPARPMYQKPVALFVGKAWDEVKEREGWVFVRKGNAYGAIRVLLGERDTANRIRLFDVAAEVSVGQNRRLTLPAAHPWKWSADGAAMLLDDMFSPIIIEGGRQAEYGSFADFQAAIIAAKVELLKTVVPGYNLVKYKSPAKNAPEISFNAATPDIPQVDGKYISYRLDKCFQSPFVQSQAGDVITIHKGQRSLKLDFAPASP